MSDWRDQLAEHLDRRRDDGLLRRLRAVDRCDRLVRRGDRTLINLAGNDYLGLASHPHLIEAASRAARELGAGAGASRLVTGHLDIHERVERRFAAFKHAEAALLTSTGYMANLAAVTALAGPDDLVCLDKLNHASLIDAARASGATVRIYPHRRLGKLRRLLEQSEARRKIIVTDAVFSMDGDCADLPALCEARDAFGAILIVDEAHATGVLGGTGAGLAEQQQVAGRIDVTVSTASKALGGLGGVVTGPRIVIDTLVNHARSFIYTTAVPPAQAAAIDAAIDVVRDEPHRRDRLGELGGRLRRGLRAAGWDSADDPTPIVPVVAGESDAAMRMSRRLEARGFLAPAIRPPTVPRGAARVRLSLRADLHDDDVDQLVDAIGPREK